MKLIIGFLLLISIKGLAQFPENGASLNYTHIPFQWKADANATHYYLQIKDANKKIIYTNKIIGNGVLLTDICKWNKNYTWQVQAFKQKTLLNQSEIYSFSIGINQPQEVQKVKFSVSNFDPKLSSKDLVFIENIGSLIDRKGNIVWYLQKDESITVDDKSFRSMQMTKEGNFTFLTLSGCYETDLQGNIIWQAPSYNATNPTEPEQYHHHFEKTKLGTYMCASYQFVKQPHYKNAAKTTNVRYNTMVEWDKNNTQLWSWNEKDQIDQRLLFDNSTGDEDDWAGTHMNGFVYDEKNNAYFLSFRNTSQIIAVDYLTKKTFYTWNGKASKFNQPQFSFLDQHGPHIDANGNLLIYNNNIQKGTDKKAYYPTIQRVSNPLNKTKGNLIWEYECIWDKKPEGIQTKEGFAKALKNGNILVSVGGTERIFEITNDKKIVWDCSFEKLKSPDSDKIVPFSNYRAYSTSFLHPVFFSIQKSNADLVIQNLGAEDSYTIVIKTGDGLAEIKRATLQTNAQNKATAINLFNKTLSTYKSIIVEVSSNNNALKKQSMLVSF
jgi:hypothetical protein